MFEIELLLAAEDELSEAYDWYQEQLPDLGDKFYKEIDHYLYLIYQNPFHFPVKYKSELRAASLNKFPFIIIYWVDEVNRKTFVTSIFHTSRKPKHS
ncbi:type II toxin-antitoxin system RelE/ParE family toxin [Mucilaginibacter flavus]|uniref:type II toxin-antitoxin system RelE/ParE family toxin n=1 Tax=Mucilaginibacter flavus TaxID=931504 RepID=UPI0025B49E3B|nr:type II toxin-antitoxin system RelE/ParE family toxin [Mucilaginibacter flavus]